MRLGIATKWCRRERLIGCCDILITLLGTKTRSWWADRVEHWVIQTLKFLRKSFSVVVLFCITCGFFRWLCILTRGACIIEVEEIAELTADFVALTVSLDFFLLLPSVSVNAATGFFHRIVRITIFFIRQLDQSLLMSDQSPLVECGLPLQPVFFWLLEDVSFPFFVFTGWQSIQKAVRVV